MGGALDCKCNNSFVYSSGNKSGMVAESCATFIRGPFMLPRASLISRACFSLFNFTPRYF